MYSEFWEPDMVTDEGRSPIRRWAGHSGVPDWIEDLNDNLTCTLDPNIGQDRYLMIAFEAAAMAD